MMHANVRRGYVESDASEFSPQQVNLMRQAQRDIVYLVDHGYEISRSVKFIGDRFMFSARQRAALTRATARTESRLLRQQKRLYSFAGNTIYIDGFNLIITLEAALSPETTLIGCMDGTVRDLCGLRGTYRLIESTTLALNMLAELIAEGGAERAIFYLDAPVSNSGRLRAEILQVMERHAIQAEVELVPNADAMLWDKDCVASSDAIILDRCNSWINLAELLITENLPRRLIIDLSMGYR